MFLEFKNKLDIIIGDNIIRNTIKNINLINKGYNKFFDYQVYNGDKMLYFNKLINNYYNIFKFMVILFICR